MLSNYGPNPEMDVDLDYGSRETGPAIIGGVEVPLFYPKVPGIWFTQKSAYPKVHHCSFTLDSNIAAAWNLGVRPVFV